MIKIFRKMVDSILTIKDLFQHAAARVSKSNILHPITWAIAILLPAALTSYKIGAPAIISAIIFSFFVLSTLILLFFFVYYGFKNPDLLRTEKYLIQKTLIEKGLFGDNLTGILDSETVAKIVKIGASSESNPTENK